MGLGLSKRDLQRPIFAITALTLGFAGGFIAAFCAATVIVEHVWLHGDNGMAGIVFIPVLFFSGLMGGFIVDFSLYLWLDRPARSAVIAAGATIVLAFVWNLVA